MNTFETKDHIAIISGSAQGMGKEFARQLLEAGARVCISDISPEVGQKTAQEFQEIFGQDKVTFKECNVIKEEDWNILWNHAEEYFGDQVTLLVSDTRITGLTPIHLLKVKLHPTYHYFRLTMLESTQHMDGNFALMSC